MPIISPLPYNIANGDPVDATPVTANFTQIVNDVNSGAAAVGGLASQEFFVAPTTSPAGAVPLLQAQEQFAALGGSSTQSFFVGPAVYAQAAVPLAQIQDNFAALGGSATQGFLVAPAVYTQSAVPLLQAQEQFAAIGGSTLHEFSVANATLTQSAVPLIQIIGGGDAVNYNNMSGSRSLNTAYTNTTGRVLVVCVQINASSPTHTDIAGAVQVGMSNGSAINGAFASAAVAGNDFPPVGGNYNYSGSTMFIVPPNGVGMASFVPYLTDIVSSTYTWFEY
jgi:hypothetical protein